MKFKSTKPHYEYLRKKWINKHKVLENNLWKKHSSVLKNFAAASVGGLILFASPAGKMLPDTEVIADSSQDAIKNYDEKVLLVERLKKILPEEVRPLESKEEEKILDILNNSYNIRLVSEMSGIRLNRNYGRIGGEQHLYRYPGDNIYAHAENSSDWAMYGSSGIAPGLGAWGYFAQSKDEFREIDKLRERYYIAIPTFLVPGYAENVAKFRDFFKYRKVMVINPNNGHAVVTDIADAGPSVWTDKHLGGSPEVMDHLGLGSGPRKGEVLYFFVDDPKDEVRLGSINYKND